MKIGVVLLVTVFVYVLGEDDRGDLSERGEDLKFSNLPKDIQSDFFHILTGAANALGGSCLGIEPDYNKVELLLYTNASEAPAKIDPKNPAGIDTNSTLYILSHGWVSGLNGYKIKAFRDKYIHLYGKNVLFINWGKLAWYPYPTAACNIPFIGQHLAKFLCHLHETQGFDLGKVHFTGHSLGGQLAGQTGKGTKKLCGQTLGRITALDPAGPLFQFNKEEGRLVPSDAEFVEAVHSNSGLFGYMGKAGTVDYHLNCGSIQPGCIIPKEFSLSAIAETSIYLLCCPHMRSIEVWPYVLESQDFKAKSCRMCGGIMPGGCLPDPLGATFATLGHTYSKLRGDHYNLITSSYSPFRLGCGAFPFQGCS